MKDTKDIKDTKSAANISNIVSIKKKPSRIVLEKPAQESLAKMLIAIREEGKFVKVSPSRLASWIILHFETKHFPKQKDSIIKAHFSSKTYLRNVAQTLEDSPNLEKVLKEALNRIALKGKKHD